ncbi:MAG: tRNA threonylcarbamoyladenosine biosynthesis protein TsaE [Candidatus Azotimanducaceae bacterium]|jgi:tRNA threonylcarbamoyladenosine biosynthesis protein TsaE
MIELGFELAAALGCQGAVFIRGQLGAGKTTLSRGILRGLGHTGAVKSPTFTLVEPYQLAAGEVFHFDLYRLADPGELEYIGVDEYFGDGRLCLIEWPEKAEGWLPQSDLEIVIDVSAETRNIVIQAKTPYGESVCKQLSMHKAQ